VTIVIENFKITLLTERAAGVENSAAALSVTGKHSEKMHFACQILKNLYNR
jgi:hypothetical protein